MVVESGFGPKELSRRTARMTAWRHNFYGHVVAHSGLVQEVAVLHLIEALAKEPFAPPTANVRII